MTPPQGLRRQIIRDIWGDEWSVYERRSTPYRFDLVLGRPYPPINIRGGSGGTGVVVTAPLAAHLRAHARRPYASLLPVGRDAIRRVRGLLGLHQQAWDDKRLEWWIERVDDLATMSVPEFVAQYRREAWTRSGSLSEARVWQMRIALLGRRRRPIGWWKTPAVRTLVEGDLPASIVAARLHISPMIVRGIRWRLAHVRVTTRGAGRARRTPQVVTLASGRVAAPAATRVETRPAKRTASAPPKAHVAGRRDGAVHAKRGITSAAKPVSAGARVARH